MLAGCVDGDDGGDGSDGGGGSDDGNGQRADDASEDTDGSTDDRNPARGELQQRGDLSLTSPAFEDGGEIPAKYGLDGENVNPPLEIENVPNDAGSLALVVDDPDAVEPTGQVWLHWIVWNVAPERRAIPEDWTPEDAEEGRNDSGEIGYSGPSPPDRAHRYRFKLFALDATLDLPVATDATALGEAMAGHVLAQTQLDGTFPV
ncbi:Raf kinase inhibitor-like protein, YbhB/YbcL family [Salinarchaeum sp. Harcht-Bsk1]|nr:Raf kinase inhibitor-like protein, YbhB/YbcL family [Salinarchaeum sp. Harcht-Bsk1]